MPKILIRDAVDIDQVLTDSSSQERTQALRDNAEINYSTLDLRHQHLKVYSLFTTSDKVINMRTYPDEHVQDMAKNHSWTTPYPKPLQTNHNTFDDANARFYDSWYLNHKDLKPQYGYSTLPKGVIDCFEERGAFKEGTGSTIGMAETANLDFKRKIIDGTYLTTSQGANTDSLTCNICGEPYHVCSHSRGTTYPILGDDKKTVTGIKMCVPFTGPLEAVEDSVVNVPANVTSTLLVYDTKKDRVVTLDNISEYKDIFDVRDFSTESNVADTTKPNKENVIQDKNNTIPGLTDEQIKKLKEMLDNNVQPVITDILENTIQTNDKIGGDMPNPFKETAKRFFREDMKKTGVTDEEKINKFYETLSDTELDISVKILDFITSNAVVETVTEPVVEKPVEDAVEPTPEPTPAPEPEPTPEVATAVTDSAEYKELADKFAAVYKELCDLKGIDNTIPNISSIQTNKPAPTKKSRILY